MTQWRRLTRAASKELVLSTTEVASGEELVKSSDGRMARSSEEISRKPTLEECVLRQKALAELKPVSRYLGGAGVTLVTGSRVDGLG